MDDKTWDPPHYLGKQVNSLLSSCDELVLFLLYKHRNIKREKERIKKRDGIKDRLFMFVVDFHGDDSKVSANFRYVLIFFVRVSGF